METKIPSGAGTTQDQPVAPNPHHFQNAKEKLTTNSDTKPDPTAGINRTTTSSFYVRFNENMEKNLPPPTDVCFMANIFLHRLHPPSWKIHNLH